MGDRRQTTEYAGFEYYLDLKGAYENLCRAQTHAPSPDKLILQSAIDAIQLAAMDLPNWSRFDQPIAPTDITRREASDG